MEQRLEKLAIELTTPGLPGEVYKVSGLSTTPPQIFIFVWNLVFFGKIW